MFRSNVRAHEFLHRRGDGALFRAILLVERVSEDEPKRRNLAILLGVRVERGDDGRGPLFDDGGDAELTVEMRVEVLAHRLATTTMFRLPRVGRGFRVGNLANHLAKLFRRPSTRDDGGVFLPRGGDAASTRVHGAASLSGPN